MQDQLFHYRLHILCVTGPNIVKKRKNIEKHGPSQRSFLFSFWSTTMHGTMFAAREHFIQQLLVAILVHASLGLLEASGGSDLHTFVWFLRPHHHAEDFRPLLLLLRSSFEALAFRHACPLSDKVCACVIDGKRSIQTPVCNDRASGMMWGPNLCLGYFPNMRGLMFRPKNVAVQSRQHLAGSRRGAAQPCAGLRADLASLEAQRRPDGGSRFMSRSQLNVSWFVTHACFFFAYDAHWRWDLPSFQRKRVLTCIAGLNLV